MSATLNLGTLLARLSVDDRMTKALASAEKALDRVNRAAQKVAVVAAAAFASMTAIIAKAVSSYDSLEMAMARVRAAGRKLGPAFDYERSLKFAEAMQQVSRFSDDMLLSAQAVGYQAGLNQVQTEHLTRSVMDLAQATGLNLNRAMLLATRSIHGSATMLERYGVFLSESERAAWDNVQPHERLHILMRAIEGSMGGMAQSGAQAALSWKVLGHQIANSWEELGKVLDAPVSAVLDSMTGAVKNLLAWWASLSQETRDWVGTAGVAATAIAGVTAAISGLIVAAIKLGPILLGSFGPVLAAVLPLLVILAGVVLIIGAIRTAWKAWGEDIARWVGERLRGVRDTIRDINRHVSQNREDRGITLARQAVQGLEGDAEAAARALERLVTPTVSRPPPVDLTVRATPGGLVQGMDLPTTTYGSERVEAAKITGAMADRIKGVVDELRSGAIDVATAIERVQGVGVDNTAAVVARSEGAITGFLKQSAVDIKDTFLEGLDFLGGLLPEFEAMELPEPEDYEAKLREAIQATQDEMAAREAATAAARSAAEALDNLARVQARISALSAGDTETDRLRREWAALANDLKLAGKAAGADVSAGVKDLAKHFGGAIADAQAGAARELELSMGVISGEISSTEAAILREWDSTAESIKALGAELELPASEIKEMLEDVAEHFQREIDKAGRAVEQIGPAVDTFGDTVKALSDKVLGGAGAVGGLVQSGMQGMQMGGPMAAAAMVGLDLLMMSEQFGQLIEKAGEAIQMIADVLGVIFVPMLTNLGGAILLVTSVLELIQPLLEILGEAFTFMAPFLVILATVFSALAPVFQTLGMILQPLMSLLEMAFGLLFNVIKFWAMGILWVVWAIQKAWNWIVEALAGLLETFRLNKAAESLREMTTDVDATRESIQELADLTWEAAMAQAEAAGAIEDLGDAANAATEALLNVPRGFRVARARWAAQDPAGGMFGGGMFDAALGSALASIPRLASGGIVTAPTLALIGEAGPEAVVPLKGKSGGMGGDTFNLHFHGRRGEGDEAFARRVARTIEQQQSRRAVVRTGSRITVPSSFSGDQR